MPEVASLKLTNTIIYVLSLIGSLVFIFVGLTRGQCVEYCGDTYAEYTASPAMVATGFAAILVSSLLFQVITLFAVHVEKSHAGR
jgi:hypothetical protein